MSSTPANPIATAPQRHGPVGSRSTSADSTTAKIADAPGFEHVEAATQREPAEQDRDGRQLPPEHDLRKMDAAFARQFDAGEQSGQHECGGEAQHQRKQGPMVGVIAFGLHRPVR